MYENVLTVLNDYQSAWNTVPGIVTAAAEFQNLLNSLSPKLNLQNTLTQGIRHEKDAYLKDLIADMSKLKKGLLLYAMETNNLVLRERNRDTKSTLTHLSGSLLQVTTMALLEDLQMYGAELGMAGINQEQIQQFQAKVTEFENRKNSVRQAIIERSMETKAINSLEKQINRLLIDRLDRFISLLNIPGSNFQATYQAARKVIDTGGHTGHKPNETSEV